MAVFSLHAPSDQREPEALAARLVVLRQGFTRAGFVFGPLWLLARRLWRPFAVWALAAVIVALLINSGALSGCAALLLYALGALYIGFEGRAMEEARLARRGLVLRGLAAAEDADIAAARFLGGALGENRAGTPAQPARRPSSSETIIGLFPEAGG